MATWFPCQHPEHVRIAQSAAWVEQLPSAAASIIGVMLLGVAVQVWRGALWTALAWQCAMGALAYFSFTTGRHVRESLPREVLSERHLRRVTVAAGIYGVFWALGLIAWMSGADAQWALIAIGVSLAYSAHVLAAHAFLPGAVLAFSVPVLAGCIFVSAVALRTPVAQVCILLVAVHALAAFHHLRKSWVRFAAAIDRDTERNRLEAMLQEQKEIAERAVQQKTRFLASASHDLRQPMHAISLYLDGLAEADLPERIRAVVTDAKVCAHDLNDMFRSLLDMSRLDAQQAVPALSVFSIGSVLSRVEKEFLPLAATRDVRLKVRPCAHHVYSDPVMVERIALNFVSNAVRHTTNGRVLVACRAREGALRLAVYDTGRGIPESEHQAIFDEFRRLDRRPADRTGGLGLGLAIVRRLAQALRLPVTVRSTPGRGSMFAVDLPLVHVSRRPPQAPASESPLSGRLVLLVDDEPSILAAASFMLEAAGCEVISARSSQDAMRVLAGSTRVPDVIICDYELNEACKGSDVVRNVREEFNLDIPALLVTGNTFDGMADRSASELGISVLYKPLEAAVLKSTLEELLLVKER